MTISSPTSAGLLPETLAKKSKLVNVTINLPEVYIGNIDLLVNAGIYHSRSECLRAAIRDFLIRDMIMGEEFQLRARELQKALRFPEIFKETFEAMNVRGKVELEPFRASVTAKCKISPEAFNAYSDTLLRSQKLNFNVFEREGRLFIRVVSAI